MHQQDGGHEQPRIADDSDVDRLPVLIDGGAETSSTNYSAGTVWSGQVSMTGVEDFRVHAIQVAGTDHKEQLWHQGSLMSTLNIIGRIPIQIAAEYVLGARRDSTSKRVVVLSLVPNSDDDNTYWRQVHTYFREKERWGVVNSAGHCACICYAYIVPVESCTGNLPAFLDAMEDVQIEQPRKDQLLLLVLIVEHGRNSQGLMSAENADHILGDMLNYPVFSDPIMKVLLPRMCCQMLENLRDLLQEHTECREGPMQMATTLNQLCPTDPPTAA